MDVVARDASLALGLEDGVDPGVGRGTVIAQVHEGPVHARHVAGVAGLRSADVKIRGRGGAVLDRFAKLAAGMDTSPLALIDTSKTSSLPPREISPCRGRVKGPFLRTRSLVRPAEQAEIERCRRIRDMLGVLAPEGRLSLQRAGMDAENGRRD